MSTFEEDIERLADIGDRVLSGEPVESFELTRLELLFVLGYTRRGVETMLGPVEESGDAPG